MKSEARASVGDKFELLLRLDPDTPVFWNNVAFSVSNRYLSSIKLLLEFSFQLHPVLPLGCNGPNKALLLALQDQAHASHSSFSSHTDAVAKLL